MLISHNDYYPKALLVKLPFLEKPTNQLKTPLKRTQSLDTAFDIMLCKKRKTMNFDINITRQAHKDNKVMNTISTILSINLQLNPNARKNTIKATISHITKPISVKHTISVKFFISTISQRKVLAALKLTIS
ncbi:MAG: hypothetical protein QM504_06085 [Pseudomonadota bacterium]